jgi:tetratricopeptide (TPR) repeat protein
MKKILFLTCLMFLYVTVNSQSINTQSAYNALKDANRAKSAIERQNKLATAKKFIDDAAANSETAQDAKTWFYRGLIYLNLVRYNPTPDSALYTTAIISLKKANEYDKKKNFTEEIKVNVDTMRQGLYQKGVDYFNKTQFTESMYTFERAAKIYDIINQTDTAVLITAAVAAERAARYDKARDYYLAVLKAGGKYVGIYYGLTVFYTKLKDKDNALKIVAEGRKLYPKNLELIKAETNTYLAFSEDKKAMEQLKVIAAADTANYSVFFAMGALYDKIHNDTSEKKEAREQALNMAVQMYKKAIEINPKYFDAYFNIGSLYNNIAVEILLKANNLPNDAEKEYQVLKAEADKNLDLALPFLEKSAEIQPNDLNTLVALKQIYARKNMADKVKQINDIINALKKK